MKITKKRFASLLLVAVMLLSLMPAEAMAAVAQNSSQADTIYVSSDGDDGNNGTAGGLSRPFPRHMS